MTALKSGHVAGAAFDVFEVETATNNVLFGCGYGWQAGNLCHWHGTVAFAA